MFPPIRAAVALLCRHYFPLFRVSQRVALIAMMLTALLALTPPAAEAATFPVNATDDSDDGSCDAIHCSLREAINAANANAGVDDTIEFDIPMVFPNNCTFANPIGERWCTITLTGDLPTLTDSGTTIDGFTQPNTNTGALTSPRPGVLDAANPCPAELTFEKPDVAIDANIVASNPLSIGSTADDIEIRGLSIYNAGPFLGLGTPEVLAAATDGHAIVGLPGPDLATAPQDRDVVANFVGVLPDGSDPGVLRNQDFGIRQLSPGFLTIGLNGGADPNTGNYVGHNGTGGIDGEASQSVVEVERNEAFDNGWASLSHDGLDINGILSYAACNYSHHNTNASSAPKGDAGNGIEIGSKSANATLNENLVEYNTMEMNVSAGLSIRKGPRGNSFRKNVIFNNWVGITVDTEGRVPTNRNELSRNSTFTNMSPASGGIDLNATKQLIDPITGLPVFDLVTGEPVFIDVAWTALTLDGLTPNDFCDEDGSVPLGTLPGAPDGDAGNYQSNDLQNFPDVTSATAIGSNLQVTGTLNTWPNRWYRIEFFRTPAGENVLRGEGKIFIGAIRVFAGADCNATFNHTFVGAGVPAGDEVTATATRDENAAEEDAEGSFDDVWSTSEYSEPEVVDLFLPEGKVTGGGFILNEPPVCSTPCNDNGATSFRANYGFNASYHKNNFDPFGHTNFVYKPGNIHLSSLDYVFASLDIDRDILDPSKGTARWRGSAKVNNKKGFCFEVFVRDDGEPGTTDRWQIKIWSNPAAASDGEVCSADGTPFYDSGDQMVGGGNIQLHPTNP